MPHPIAHLTDSDIQLILDAIYGEARDVPVQERIQRIKIEIHIRKEMIREMRGGWEDSDKIE